MLHSGSRGVGNRIGTYFIELAKRDMRKHMANLKDADLAYFREGSEHFEDYVFAVDWAQGYARENRRLMMEAWGANCVPSPSGESLPRGAAWPPSSRRTRAPGPTPLASAP